MKCWLKVLGTVAGIAAGIFFIVYAQRALQGYDLSVLIRPRILLTLALLTLLYAALIPVTAVAWSLLLRGLGRQAPIAVTAPILAISQFGKYLPGNVAHHASRLIMAKSTGIGMGGGILSIAYESVLTLLACAHVSALTFLWDTPKGFDGSLIGDNRMLLIVLATSGAVATLIAAPHLARAVWRLRNRGNADAQPPVLHPGFAALMTGYLCYVINFALVGIGLWGVTSALVPGAGGISPVLLTGAFASSWLIGFITPGAPAGLGVREAVLTFWLSESLPAETVVVLVLALRIATTLGDLFSLVWGSLALKLRQENKSNPSVP